MGPHGGNFSREHVWLIFRNQTPHFGVKYPIENLIYRCFLGITGQLVEVKNRKKNICGCNFYGY
jgi:hypothetical protein